MNTRQLIDLLPLATLERFLSGWFVTRIKRVPIYPGESTKARLDVPESKQEHIMRKLLRDKGFAFVTRHDDVPTQQKQQAE